ncbi:hypothetical protein UFOVP112_402 [uncultured Caudovirales phage]|uniref:Uncharacterized protein n=1 Tax=uncultured Caudovirales phage TaxID=2100421 RepID=A0A6J5L4E5_9CAUD|nr:hypothetical protein UFOVP112_402 [uncultured Caudovirales phage]
MAQTVRETRLFKKYKPNRSEMNNGLMWKRLKFLRQNLARAANRPNPQEITVTLDYVYSVGVKQDWKDPYTGDKLEFERGGNWGMTTSLGTSSNPNSCSIDRINSSLGYVPGNIQLVSAKTNLAKGNMSSKEFIQFCKKVAKYNK